MPDLKQTIRLPEKCERTQAAKTLRKSMNNHFDELTKSLAQSVTRRAALKKFGLGLAGMALTFFGLTNGASASPDNLQPCTTAPDCGKNQVCLNGYCATPCINRKDCPGRLVCCFGYCSRCQFP